MRRASWGGVEWHLTHWAFGIIGWPPIVVDALNYHAAVMLGPVTCYFDFDRPVTVVRD